METEAWFSDNIYWRSTLQNIVNVSLLQFKRNDNNDSYGVFIGTNIYQYGTAEAILSNGNYLVHKLDIYDYGIDEECCIIDLLNH